VSRIRFKRGLEANRQGIIPTDGEPVFTTDGKKLYVGDGATPGGVPVEAGGVAPVQSVAGKTGAVTLDKADVGLDNVDNTSDAIKNSASATLTNKFFGDNNIVGSQLRGGGGLFVNNSVLGMGGQGVQDFSITGFHDRNQLVNVDLRGTVTFTFTGSGNQPTTASVRSMFNAESDFGTIGGMSATTSKIVIHVDNGSVLPNFAAGVWHPYVQFRLTGVNTTWFKKVTVEVSQNNTDWFKPSGGAWETTDFLADARVPTLWMGQNAAPGMNFIRYIRFTLEDINFVANASCWIVQLGLRHYAAPMAPQYVRTEGGVVFGDMEYSKTTQGTIHISPNGTRYRLKVANDGSLSTEAV